MQSSGKQLECGWVICGNVMDNYILAPIVRMIDILHQVKTTDEFLGRRDLGAHLGFRISETL